MTPGQGQTVHVAGVTSARSPRSSSSGRPRGRDDEDPQEVRADLQERDRAAAAQDRPQRHGRGARRRARRRRARRPTGCTIPVSQTLPNVNFDEILAALDTDTRSYLQLLIGGGGRGLDGNGKDLSATFRRFEPTSRDIAEDHGAARPAPGNIRRSIHNFSVLPRRVGDQGRAAGGAGRRVQRGVPGVRRPGRERCARRCSSCPATLTDDRHRAWPRPTGSAGARADARRPAARRPRARAVAEADRGRSSADDAGHPERSCGRSRATRCRRCKVLRPAARDLAALTPGARRPRSRSSTTCSTSWPTTRRASEEGYLFWVVVANHIGPTVFSTQDAHGPIRRGALSRLSCSALGLLRQR